MLWKHRARENKELNGVHSVGRFKCLWLVIQEGKCSPLPSPNFFCTSSQHQVIKLDFKLDFKLDSIQTKMTINILNSFKDCGLVAYEIKSRAPINA